MDDAIRGAAVILIVVLFNALVIAARNALENVNEAAVQKRADEGDKKAERVLKLLKEPERYIDFASTLLMISGIISGMIFSLWHYKRIFNLIQKLTGSNVSGIVTLVMLLVDFIIMQFIAVIGVMLPKKLAKKHSETFACSLSGFMSVVLNIFRPLLFIVNKGTNFCLRIVGINPSELVDDVTEEEIISIVNEGQEKGVLEEDEAEMISNIIELDEKEAKDIMTHRRKIVAINSEMTIEEALNFMMAENFSRFPLYTGDIDNIVGILNFRDVMRFYLDDKLRKKPLIHVAREAFFVPDTLNINVLFRDMQKKKMHMAVAIDEYGQTAGIVAMEDILEEIVGDIQDEYDEEEEMIVIKDEKNGIYEVNGEINLGELSEKTGIVFLNEDIDSFDTLSGLLVSKLEHIPSNAVLESIDYCGYEFDVIEVKDNMISKVRISRRDNKEDTEENSQKDV